jgi:hypothetical protein
MGAVADFVADVVVDPFEAAGDVIEFVAEEVVEPVLQEAVKQVERAVEDPIGTAAMVLSVMYPPAAPFIMPATTALKGGDLEDIALSAGLSYLGSEIATNYAPDVASILPDGITDATARQITSVGTNALVAGTKAEINGGDFFDVAGNALVTGGITAGVSDVINFAKNEYNSYTPTMTDVPVQDTLATPDTSIEDAPVSTPLAPVDMPTVSVDDTSIDDTSNALPLSTGVDAQNIINEYGQPTETPTTNAQLDGSAVPTSLSDLVNTEVATPGGVNQAPSGGLAAVSDTMTSQPVAVSGLGDKTATVATDIGAINRADDETPQPVARNAADMPTTQVAVEQPTEQPTDQTVQQPKEEPSKLGAVAEKYLTRAATGALTGAAMGVVRPTGGLPRRAMPNRLSPTQMATIRMRQQAPAPAPMMPTVAPSTANKFKLPAQYADISKLTPVSNISGLTALLKRLRG